MFFDRREENAINVTASATAAKPTADPLLTTSHRCGPAFEAANLPWYGWHAFRRGLATNLNRLGVSDKAIQQILRHANVTTTMNIYVKMLSEDATLAMKTFEANCATAVAARWGSGRCRNPDALLAPNLYARAICGSSGGEGGIRTLDTGVSPYNGLANRRLQPLGHLSGV